VARSPKAISQRLELVENSSFRGLLWHSTDKAGNIHSEPYKSSELPFSCHTPAPGRVARGPSRVFFAAGAGGVTIAETFVGAAAKVWPTSRTRRRYIAARVPYHCTEKAGDIYSAPLKICRVALLLPHARAGGGTRRRCECCKMRQRRPERYSQRLELVDGTSPRGIRPPRCKSCRVVLFLLRQCRGTAGLDELQ
jgi:hypothetical protein